MSEKEDMEDPFYRRLVVEESMIRVGGSSRINTSDLEAIGAKSGDQIVVAYNKEAILIRVHGDPHMTPGKIKMRKKDEERLGVGNGDVVIIAIRDMLAKLKELFEEEEEEED